MVVSCAGTADGDKKRFLAQVAGLDASYHGGLAAYLSNARKLLEDSKEGEGRGGEHGTCVCVGGEGGAGGQRKGRGKGSWGGGAGGGRRGHGRPCGMGLGGGRTRRGQGGMGGGRGKGGGTLDKMGARSRTAEVGEEGAWIPSIGGVWVRRVWGWLVLQG